MEEKNILDLKTLFINFLKENNIYNDFNVYCSPIPSLIEEGVVGCTIMDYYGIINTFNWSITKQGHSFWYEMHRKWKETMNKYIIKTFIKKLKQHNFYGDFIYITKIRNINIKTFLNMSLDLEYYPHSIFLHSTMYHTKEFNNLVEEWRHIVINHT